MWPSLPERGRRGLGWLHEWTQKITSRVFRSLDVLPAISAGSRSKPVGRGFLPRTGDTDLASQPRSVAIRQQRWSHSLFPPRSLWSGRLSRRDQDLSESRCRLSWCISSKLASGATVRSIVACNVGNLLVAKICEPGFKLSKHQSLRLRMLHYRTSLGRLRRGANSGSFAPFSARRLFPWVRSCLPARHSGTSGTLHNARYGNTTKLGVCSPRARYSTSIRARSPSRRWYPSAE